MKAVARESDDADDREHQHREPERDRDMAGRRECADPRDQPEQVAGKHEDEHRKDQRREPASFGTDIFVEHLADEIIDIFDRGLRATRDQLRAGGADDEKDRHRSERDQHP